MLKNGTVSAEKEMQLTGETMCTRSTKEDYYAALYSSAPASHVWAAATAGCRTHAASA